MFHDVAKVLAGTFDFWLTAGHKDSPTRRLDLRAARILSAAKLEESYRNKWLTEWKWKLENVFQKLVSAF